MQTVISNHLPSLFTRTKPRFSVELSGVVQMIYIHNYWVTQVRCFVPIRSDISWETMKLNLMVF